jgi:hypothetical protein
MGVMCKIWLVVDGAYAARPVIGPLRKQGVVVFTRLRKDAMLFDLPAERKVAKRGRPRVYGVHRIHLHQRATKSEGWQSITYRCRSEEVTREYKTFLATSRLVGGVIRVVIVRFDNGSWAAYCCTDPQTTAQDILTTVSARWAIEEHFHDVKEIWGAGQQQVRNVWSNVGCWHLNQWMYTLVELCSWDVAKSDLSDRSDRPWDRAGRRPSHADRRRAIAREMLENQYLNGLPKTPDNKKYRTLIEAIIRLAA